MCDTYRSLSSHTRPGVVSRALFRDQTFAGPRSCGIASSRLSSSLTDSAKSEFIDAVRPTLRGSAASPFERGRIEELVTRLESTVARESVDFSKLYGPSGSRSWDVLYTTARDVSGIVKPRPVPFGEATLCGQRFGSDGSVTNFIRLTAVVDQSFPIVSDTLAGTSVNLKVNAQWKVTGPRSIGLRFLSASVGEIELEDGSPVLALLTSSILPRGQWNLDVINGLRTYRCFELLVQRIVGSCA